MISAVLILPAARKDAGNALAVALGHDVPPGQTYSVPLASEPSGAPTHYGCHTWARPAFVAMIEAAKGGTVPDGLPEGAAAVVSDLLASFRDDAAGHWADVLRAAGLSVCVVAERAEGTP